MADQEYSYDDYWEKCWDCEDVNDLSRFLSSWNGHKSAEMDIFTAQGVKKVCDAACGFGAHTIALLSNGFDVEAFDVSQRAVELTAAGLEKNGYENVKVKTASILDTGYADATFDAATAYAVMDHLIRKDAERAIRELMRIVKAGGLVLMSFDKAEEEDLSMPHRSLEDGSMLYDEGTPNAGLLFHPYEESEIKDLVKEYKVQSYTTDKKGSKIIILEK